MHVHVHVFFACFYYYFIFLDLIKKVLGQNEKIRELAKELHHHKSIIVMGRGFNYATCLEGALVRYALLVWLK